MCLHHDYTNRLIQLGKDLGNDLCMEYLKIWSAMDGNCLIIVHTQIDLSVISSHTRVSIHKTGLFTYMGYIYMIINIIIYMYIIMLESL